MTRCVVSSPAVLLGPWRLPCVSPQAPPLYPPAVRVPRRRATGASLLAWKCVRLTVGTWRSPAQEHLKPQRSPRKGVAAGPFWVSPHLCGRGFPLWLCTSFPCRCAGLGLSLFPFPVSLFPAGQKGKRVARMGGLRAPVPLRGPVPRGCSIGGLLCRALSHCTGPVKAKRAGLWPGLDRPGP